MVLEGSGEILRPPVRKKDGGLRMRGEGGELCPPEGGRYTETMRAQPAAAIHLTAARAI